MEKAFAAIETKEPLGVSPPPAPGSASLSPKKVRLEAFGRPREFLGNRFVYGVISQRAHGLSIGINVNPDKTCNFDCTYCEVNREQHGSDLTVDLDVLSTELKNLLTLTFQGRLRELPYFASVPNDLLVLKGVALSGDGEPTLSPQFDEILREVIYVRSQGQFPFFKLVLITNTAGLDLPDVRRGIDSLTSRDEIWAKLDAGSQEHMNRVNRTGMSLQKVLDNILLIARERPVIIQSLFPLLDRQEPPPQEIEFYVQRLVDLTKAGAKIPLVQIYSAHRPAHHPACDHLPLKALSRIAQRVREVTGLRAEVF